MKCIWEKSEFSLKISKITPSNYGDARRNDQAKVINGFNCRNYDRKTATSDGVITPKQNVSPSGGVLCLKSITIVNKKSG